MYAAVSLHIVCKHQMPPFGGFFNEEENPNENT